MIALSQLVHVYTVLPVAAAFATFRLVGSFLPVIVEGSYLALEKMVMGSELAFDTAPKALKSVDL